MRAKLVGITDHYPSESSKIQYFFDCLTRKVFDQVELRVKKDSTIDSTMAKNLITYLKIAFGDPDEKGTFQCKLQKLR